MLYLEYRASRVDTVLRIRTVDVKKTLQNRQGLVELGENVPFKLKCLIANIDH